MSAPLLAGVALALAGAALAACASVLLRPLGAVLLDQCGEPHRAEFWTRMVATCMVAITVVSALMGVLVARGAPAVLAVAALLRWVLLGVLSGLAAVVAVVGAFMLRGTPPPAYGAGRPLSLGD